MAGLAAVRFFLHWPTTSSTTDPAFAGRAPTQSEYTQLIPPEDWAAVSHLFKIARNASTDSVANVSEASSIRQRGSRVRPTSVQVTRTRDPVRRSSTPPLSTSSSSSPAQRPIRPIINSKVASASTSHSDDSPDTPPARQARELVAGVTASLSGSVRKGDRSAIGSSISNLNNTRDVTVVRYSPTELEQSNNTPRRTTITSQSVIYRTSKNEDDRERDLAAPIPPPNSNQHQYLKVATASSRQGSSGSGSSPASSRSSPRVPMNDVESVRLDPGVPPTSAQASAMTPPAPVIEIAVPTRSLPEERTPAAGMKYTANIYPLAPPTTTPTWGGPAHVRSSSRGSGSEASYTSSSSSSSSSARSSGSAFSSASTTRGGGGSSSSDFTDFLSDDSEYELQQQAEERAREMQRTRVERAEDREFRDAQARLDMFELTESMGLAELGGSNAAGAGGGSAIRGREMHVGIANGTIGRRGMTAVGARYR